MDARTWNIFQLGFGFMLVFTGFDTQSFIEETVLSSVSDDTGRVDEHAGYYSLSIIYAVFTVANLMSPPIIAVLGAKWSMAVGGSTYVIFLASFFYINTWLLYFTSALLGFGAALLWNGEGNYLTMNSDEKTAGRHSGIVWALYMSSLISGGIFLTFIFDYSTTHIPQATIRILYAFFAALGVLGVITLALLRSPLKEQLHEQPKQNHIKNLMSTFHLMLTKNMAFLAVVSLYLGMELTFWNGIYTTSLSFTRQFGANENDILAMPLALICGFLLGLGDSCWNTQLYSILAIEYEDQSTQAFAITRFFNALAACAAYFSGSYLKLRFQLSILFFGAVLAAVCFFAAERRAKKDSLDRSAAVIA
uniref:UNC93-like protein MFSD11 n=1 Tax=Plectus sambesii TaxID=2011161 RepID=A0A914WC74_9BILA